VSEQRPKKTGTHSGRYIPYSFMEKICQNRQATPQATLHVTLQVKKLIMIFKGDLTREELQKKLELNDKENFRKLYLIPGLENNLIEMTNPDERNNTNQKYHLTSKGSVFQKHLKESK